MEPMVTLAIKPSTDPLDHAVREGDTVGYSSPLDSRMPILYAHVLKTEGDSLTVQPMRPVGYSGRPVRIQANAVACIVRGN